VLLHSSLVGRALARNYPSLVCLFSRHLPLAANRGLPVLSFARFFGESKLSTHILKKYLKIFLCSELTLGLERKIMIGTPKYEVQEALFGSTIQTGDNQLSTIPRELKVLILDFLESNSASGLYSLYATSREWKMFILRNMTTFNSSAFIRPMLSHSIQSIFPFGLWLTAPTAYRGELSLANTDNYAFTAVVNAEFIFDKTTRQVKRVRSFSSFFFFFLEFSEFLLSITESFP